MALASVTGRFEAVNARFCEILGRSSAELLGKTFGDVTHPDDVQKMQENVSRLLGGEMDEYIHEKRYLRNDGSVVWSLTTVRLLRDVQGNPDRFVGVIEEITDGKRADEKAREAAERMQMALSAGGVGDWSWDVASDLVTLGVEGARAFGLTPGTVLTWSALRELLHPEDRDPTRRAVEEAMAKGVDYRAEYRVRRNAGYAWVAAKGRPIFRPDGSAAGMSGVVQDITREKETAEIRSRLAAVVESSDDAIISISLDTTILTWNKGAERMFGLQLRRGGGALREHVDPGGIQ